MRTAAEREAFLDKIQRVLEFAASQWSNFYSSIRGRESVSRLRDAGSLNSLNAPISRVNLQVYQHPENFLMIKRGKALVLGNNTKSFLTVIRSLGRKGIQVHVAWCDQQSPCRYSRYVECYHQIPRYVSGDGKWISSLKILLQNEGFDLVIPCDDPTIIPLQVNRGEFGILPIFIFYRTMCLNLPIVKRNQETLPGD